MSKSTRLQNIVKLSTVKISMKITSELFELRNSPVNSTEIFFRLKKMAPWNATKECWTTFFLSLYFSLAWVLRLFLDFYALDQFINPSFLVLEAEHDQDINSTPKVARNKGQVLPPSFFPFKDQNLDLIMLI